MGMSAVAMVEQDVIETDISIMPYAEIVSENVTSIPDSFTPSYYLPVPGQALAEVTFQKSTSVATYSRSFNKIDAYFSYVGGLVGTIIGLIFIMSFYTEKAYEVSLARKVFLDENRTPIRSSSFSIFYYFSMTLKKLLDFARVRPNWPKTETYIRSCEEVCMQIDIAYLVRKLMFVDAAVAKLMEKHEVEALCLREKPTIDEVRAQRKRHFASELVKQHRSGLEEGKEDSRALENAESKQRIVFEEGEFFRKGSKKTEKESEDVSAVEFSEIEGDIEHLKAAVLRVAKESKRGRTRSRQIIKEIGPSTLKMMGVEEEEGLSERKGAEEASVA